MEIWLLSLLSPFGKSPLTPLCQRGEKKELCERGGERKEMNHIIERRG